MVVIPLCSFTIANAEARRLARCPETEPGIPGFTPTLFRRLALSWYELLWISVADGIVKFVVVISSQQLQKESQSNVSRENHTILVKNGRQNGSNQMHLSSSSFTVFCWIPVSRRHWSRSSCQRRAAAGDRSRQARLWSATWTLVLGDLGEGIHGMVPLYLTASPEVIILLRTVSTGYKARFAPLVSENEFA
jgi:hypothetical protein